MKEKIPENSLLLLKFAHIYDNSALIGSDFLRRPFLIFDDPESGKVISLGIKARPTDTDLDAGYHDAVYANNPRIRTFGGNEQYYLVFGEENDLQRPLSTWLDFSPLDEIKFNIHTKKVQSKKWPAGEEIANIARKGLEDKIEAEGMTTTTFRPRNCGMVIISNPYEKNKSPLESKDTHIYVIKHERNAEQVLVEHHPTVEDDDGKIIPAYVTSDEKIWDFYQEIVLGAKEQKGAEKEKDYIPLENLKPEEITLGEKIICGVAALLEYLTLVSDDYDIEPSLIDITTVPFESPGTNKSAARFDQNYVNMFYDLAKKSNAIYDTPCKKEKKKKKR